MSLPKISGTQVFSPSTSRDGQSAREFIESHKAKRRPSKRSLDVNDLILPPEEETNYLLQSPKMTGGILFRIILKYLVFFLASSFVYYVCLFAVVSLIGFFLHLMQTGWPAGFQFLFTWARLPAYVVFLVLGVGMPFVITIWYFLRNRKLLGPTHGCE